MKYEPFCHDAQKGSFLYRQHEFEVIENSQIGRKNLNCYPNDRQLTLPCKTNHEPFGKPFFKYYHHPMSFSYFQPMKPTFSRLIQGGVSWGLWGANLSPIEMARRIEQNVEMGVTSFDQADIYGNYTTEAAFGRALTISAISRDQIQLISKCGIQLVNPDRNSRVKHYVYSASYIIQQAEKSLENLQTDYLDLFLLHRPSPLMQVADIAEAVQQLQKQGKIRAFGVSNFTPAQMRYLSTELDIFANQIECSLTHWDPMENGTLFFHQQQGIQTQAWSPLGSALSLESSNPLAETLDLLAEKYNCSKAQLLIAWLLAHPASLHPVLGTTKSEHLRDAVESLDIELDKQDWFAMYEAEREREVD